MKATIRVLALLLVAVMMIGIFAGCQTTPDTTTTQAPDTTTVGKDNTPTTVDKTNAHTLDVMVMNTIGGEYDMNKIDDLEIWTYAKEILAAYGVTLNLQVVESDQYATALQTTLAGGLDNLPDMMFSNIDETLLVQAADNGLLATLQDILVYSDGTASGMYEQYPLYMARSAYNGKNYWFGEYQEVLYYAQYQGVGMGAVTGINVREDWLDDVGLTEVPDTLEEVAEYIRLCQQLDVNQTGVVDEVACVKINGFGADAGLKFFFGVPAAEFHPNLQTGEIDLAWESKNVKEWLKTIKAWIDEGLISADAIGATSESPWYKNNKAATYASYYCNSWSITTSNCPVPDGADAPNIVGVTPDLTVHPDAYLGHDSSPTMDNRKMIVSANADLEAVAHVLDVLFSDEWNEMLTWGKEGYSYMVNGDGNKVYINGAGNHTSLATGDVVHGRPVISFGIFPDVFGIYDLTSDEAECNTELELAQFQKGQNEYPVIYPNQTSSYLAVATEEELEVINEKLAEFETVSDQLYVDILLGNYDVDKDWDTIMATLNAAGMQELKEVYQARYSRWYEAYEASLG